MPVWLTRLVIGHRVPTSSWLVRPVSLTGCRLILLLASLGAQHDKAVLEKSSQVSGRDPAQVDLSGSEAFMVCMQVKISDCSSIV